MSVNVAASAPGKVVVLGEYAVLEGAPALSTAISRRARVRVTATWNRGIRIHAPDVQSEAATLCVVDDGLHWKDPSDRERLRLVDAVLGKVLAPVLADLRTSFDLSLDTSEFLSSDKGPPCKLGLGSSAALTVACTSAVAAHIARPGAAQDGMRWLDRSLQIHRTFQEGNGSGVDVATSLLGRTIVYQLGKKRVTQRPRWPGALHYRLVWTGRSASTADKLRQLYHWREHSRDEYDAHMSALSALAETGVTAFCAGDAATVIQVASTYAHALGELDAASSLGIVSTEHRRLAQLGQIAGVAYKSCGAGGGDVGIALSLDPDRLIRFDADLIREGFQPLPLTVDEPGLRLDVAPLRS